MQKYVAVKSKLISFVVSWVWLTLGSSRHQIFLLPVLSCLLPQVHWSSGEHQFLAAEVGFASSNHTQFHCTCRLVNLLLSVSITPV